MAASPCDGTYVFWHQGLGVTAAQKTATSVDVGSWDQGLPVLRLLSPSAPTVVPDLVTVVMQRPVRLRRVVAYGSF
jgi:hypothetical protein